MGELVAAPAGTGAANHSMGSVDDLPVNGRGELRSDQAAFDDRVLRGLRELSAVQRSALLLRAVLELKYHEIARALEIPEGTAMSHVHRAREVLRARLTSMQDSLEAEETA